MLRVILAVVIVVMWGTLLQANPRSTKRLGSEAVTNWWIRLDECGHASYLVYRGAEQINSWRANLRYKKNNEYISNWLDKNTFSIVPYNSDNWWDGSPKDRDLMSKITNNDVEITIKSEMRPIKMIWPRPIGTSLPKEIWSEKYVLWMTYSGTNTSKTTLEDVAFYQYMNADLEMKLNSNNSIQLQDDGAIFSTFRMEDSRRQGWGILQWDTTRNPPTYVGFGSFKQPVAWDVGPIEPPHGNVDDIYWRVENDKLLKRYGAARRDNYVCALKWSFGDLEPGQTFSHTVLLSPAVPEPATMLLLGSGLVGLAGYVRRRRKNV